MVEQYRWGWFVRDELNGHTLRFLRCDRTGKLFLTYEISTDANGDEDKLEASKHNIGTLTRALAEHLKGEK